MIKTQLNRDDALKILEMGKTFHKESRFGTEPFDAEKAWQVLDATVTKPHNYFIAYDDEFRGFILMHCGSEFFNNERRSSDLCLYIAPEWRGGSLVIRLLAAAEEWSTQQGAVDMTIYHNTGITPEKAPELFKKLGFNLNGYIFGKKLNV